MYSNGGWMISPGSCSNGLRSWPSAGDGSSRANGLEVNNRKARKPTLIMPITASTRATTGSGSWRENPLTAALHSASTSVHSSSEPSCAPHTAE
ncbi:hypothetical protein D3C81_2076980 [compost metagenome]